MASRTPPVLPLNLDWRSARRQLERSGDQSIARTHSLEAPFQPRLLVALAGSVVVVEVTGFHAGGKQGVAL